MTRIPTPFTVLAVAVSSALLAGCLSGGGASSTGNSTLNLSNNQASNGSNIGSNETRGVAVSGKVLNVGYVENARVCLDSNDNQQCDSNEPQTVSAADGSYALTAPAGSRGAQLLAELRPASRDSGYLKTAGDGNPIQHGWTLAALLEYEPGASAVQANISPLTFTYLTRIMEQGRNRLSAKNTVLLRAGKTGNTAADYEVAVDFDYVAAAPVGLADKLKGLTDYLAARATSAGQPSAMLDTAAVLRAWYNTYNASTAPIMDASKIDALTGSNSLASGVQAFVTDGRYYRTRVDAVEVLRQHIGDIQELARKDDQLDNVLFGGWLFENGGVRWAWDKYTHASNSWQAQNLALKSDEYLTLDPNGSVQAVSATQSLAARSVVGSDGNRVVIRMPVSEARYAIEPSTDLARNYNLGRDAANVGGDWLPHPLNYSSYYPGFPGSDPAIYPANFPTTEPTCTWPPTDPQKPLTKSQWFGSCTKRLAYEFGNKIENGGGQNKVVPGAPASARMTFADFSYLDQQLKFPLSSQAPTPLYSDCASAGRAVVTVAGKQTCNWLVDGNSNHRMDELFQAGGVQIESQAQKDTGGAIRKLTLQLNADGSGTLSGVAARNVAASGALPAITAGVSVVTEPIQWQYHAKNRNVVLFKWPDLTAGAANRYALYDHFRLNDGATTFQATPASYGPSTANPAFGRVAIALQDGVFLAGMAYGAGYNSNERYLNKPAMIGMGIPATAKVIKDLYNAGFR